MKNFLLHILTLQSHPTTVILHQKLHYFAGLSLLIFSLTPFKMRARHVKYTSFCPYFMISLKNGIHHLENV
jgi:hypothetical protein